MPVIEIDPKHASDEQVVACAELCPAGLEVKSKKLVVKDPVACGYAKGCLERLDETEGITVNWDDSNFLFKFETDGSLTAQQALDIAIETLSKEAKGFAEDIKAL
jgi:DNA-directed RNA polymerase subunit D